MKTKTISQYLMPNLYKDNTEFIKQLKGGNNQAYSYLVKTYHKPLFIYAVNLTRNDTLAEDVVQNVFLKIWEYRKRLKTVNSIKSFLYKMTYNEFVNQYKKNKSFSVIDKAYIEALAEAVEDDNSDLLKQKTVLITEGIKLLPPKCKETFLLSKKEGLTNIEIAEYLNVSIKTVEGQITKGYRLLRLHIGSQLKEIFFLLFDFKKYIS